jgi:SAM-dependent methyltransferase
VRTARPTATVGVVRGSGEQSIVRPNSVDVAICLSALDHCANPDVALSNMAQALRHGGCAIIELKNARAWYRPLFDLSPRRLQRWLAPAEHAHPWSFNPRSLSSRLLAASFRQIDVYDFFYFAPFLKSGWLDWVCPMVSTPRLQRMLKNADNCGHAIAPGRGGAFMTVARK